MKSQLEKYINNKPLKEGELYFELGYLMFNQNKFRKAIDLLSEAKQLGGIESDQWKIYFLLGEAYKSISKTKEAFDHFLNAATMAGNQRMECYAEVKEIITDYPSEETASWIKDKLNSETSIPLEDQVRLELEDLLAFCQSEQIKAEDGGAEFEVSKSGDTENLKDLTSLINAGDYKNVLLKIDNALVRTPYDSDLLFSKIRALVEEQSDLKAASLLFTDATYGYRKTIADEDIKNNIEQLVADNPTRGNVFFFAAYIGNLIGFELSQIRSWAEKAESLGIQNDNVYPNLSLYILKGEIAERHSERESAGKEFFEAAKCYYWQARYAEANTYFKKVIDLHPNLNEAYIYYADSLFLLSYQNDPPYNNESLIQEAFKTWRAAPEKMVTNIYNAWYYMVISRIHEARYKFVETQFLNEYWQSILYAERALVQDPSFYSYWVNLGRYYRNLDLDWNSLYALQKAESLKAEDEFLKEEKTMSLLNVGEYDDPSAYLLDRKTKTQDYKSYLKSWEAYILFHRGKEKEAIQLYDENIKDAYSDLYAHQMKMTLLWQLQLWEEAKQEASNIIQLENYKVYPKEEFAFSWAHFISGDPDTAIALLEGFNSRAQTNTENLFSLSQFYLYNGNVQKGTTLFKIFLTWIFNKRALQDLSTRLVALENQYNKDKTGSQDNKNKFHKTILEWQKQIEGKIEEVTRNPITPLEELENKQKEYDFQPGSVPYVTIQAGLARHFNDAQNLPGAYSIYQSLLPFNDLFPEAKVALQKIEEEVYINAYALIQESKFTDVVEYIEKFLFDEFLGKPKVNMILSLAHYGSKNFTRALRYLITSFNSPSSEAYYHQVWSDLTDKAYHLKYTWGFGNFIQASIEKFNIGDRDTFHTQMTENFWNVLINKQSDLYPVVTPIAIEMSSDLVPEEANSDQWYVITILIPDMRQRMEQTYGVKPPGVRIRGNEGDLGLGTYIIMLDEIPLVMGSVQVGKLYVDKSNQELQALGITGDPAVSFIQGEQATWVNKEDKEKLNQHHIQFQEDYFRVILGHLSYKLAYNLDMFIDTQFCEYYLDLSGYEMKDQGLKNELLEKAIEIKVSSELLLQLNEVLKGLVHEQVPILRKEIILPAFLETVQHKTEATEILQYIRMALKNELPFNKLKLKHIELPMNVEKILKEELITVQGKTFLAMTPENCQEALAEIRNIVSIELSPGNLILVTKDSKLRIHLRKLVELEFPYLMVAAQEELLNV